MLTTGNLYFYFPSSSSQARIHYIEYQVERLQCGYTSTLDSVKGLRQWMLNTSKRYTNNEARSYRNPNLVFVLVENEFYP